MSTLRAIKSLLVVGSFFMTAMLCIACSARGDPATASNQTKVIPMGTTFFTTRSASSVFSVAWSPDGNHLALGYADGGVEVVAFHNLYTHSHLLRSHKRHSSVGVVA